MMQCIEIKGRLLTRYEWSGGFTPSDKDERTRRREVAKGYAEIVDTFEDKPQAQKVARKF